MDYSNFQVLAEVSVTLLGFSGITAIVGQSQFPQQGVRWRMLGLLYSSSLAFIGSALPLVGIPVLPAAVALAALSSVAITWVGMTLLDRSSQKIQANPIITWTFSTFGVLMTLYLWLSIFVLPDQIHHAYQQQIGFLLLLATVYFIRLVSSAFATKHRSENE